MTEIAGKLFTWINTRLPIVNTFERHLSKHPVPSKVNFWYLFGALAAARVDECYDIVLHNLSNCGGLL